MLSYFSYHLPIRSHHLTQLTFTLLDLTHLTFTQLCCKVATTLLPHPALLPGVKALFISVVHELLLAPSCITLILNPTVFLDGATLANNCIPPSFPWMAPSHHTA
jgi:hypothetical protein